MNEQKPVSIVMPIYNDEKYLEENLHSIKNQTHNNIEVFLVDDGSTDHSAEIAQEFCESDARFMYLKQENQGAPAARNYGFRESHGDYVIFVDSDDILKSNAVELLYLTAQKQEADLVIGQYDTIDENGTQLQIKKMQYTKDEIYEVKNHLEMLFFLSPMPGNKLYNANLLREKELRFSDLKRAQDLNFYLKYLSFADKVCTISDTTYLYRIRANSISHTVSPIVLETITSIEDVENFYQKNNMYDVVLFNTLKLKYYSDQLSKVPQIVNKQDRARTFNRLAKDLKTINRHLILEGFQSRLINVKIKLFFPSLFMSNSYGKYQTIRSERKNNVNRKNQK